MLRPVDPVLRVEETFDSPLLDQCPTGDPLGDLARSKVNGPQLNGLGIVFPGSDGSLQAGDVFLLVLVGGPVPLEFPLLALDVGGIAPWILVHGAGTWVQFKDSVHRAIQEGAVVRDDEYRSFKALQEAFEPFQGVNVQVVGRLVKEEEIRVGEKQPGQAQSGFLPTAKNVHRRVLVQIEQVQSAKHGADAGLDAVAPQPLKGSEGLIVFGQEAAQFVVSGCRHLGGYCLEAFFGLEEAGDGHFCRAAHGFVGLVFQGLG